MIITTKEQDRKAIADMKDWIAYVTKHLHYAKHWYNKMTQERELEEAQENLKDMLEDYEAKWGEAYA